MNKPEKKFTTGAVSATVWNNEAPDGKGTYQSIKLERSYQDKEGNWQTTASLRINDLPKASLLLQKAYEYIVLKEEAQVI